MIVQLSGESSTSRIRSAGSAVSIAVPAGTCAPLGAPAQISSGTANANTLPLPTTLSTQMRPAISWIRRFEIVRPRPVPPNLRVVDESAWVKLSKIRPSLSPGMPMPVSETVNRRPVGTATSSSSATCSDTSPASVNLIALPSRLCSTCNSRV